MLKKKHENRKNSRSLSCNDIIFLSVKLESAIATSKNYLFPEKFALNNLSKNSFKTTFASSINLL